MACRDALSVEIREIIRRWQEGLSQRRIARGMRLSRQTVRRYIDAVEAAGLTPDGPDARVAEGQDEDEQRQSGRRDVAQRGAARGAGDAEPLGPAAGRGAERGVALALGGAGRALAHG